MKVPRDISGKEFLRALSRLGYVPVRQRGSHMTLTTQLNGEFHVAVPMHGEIKIGTLNNILRELARHHGLTRDELIDQLEL